jgi:LuxR family maltose regulon positive regulatory protein
MSLPLLVTKLYIPPPKPGAIVRPRLTTQLTLGLNHKLILISAPAGFGKTTLASEWIASRDHAVAWVSLDEGDSDVTRFLTYFVLAIQGVVPGFGAGTLDLVRLPQAAPTDSILTALVNEISTLPCNVVIVLDDYHAIDSRSVDQALGFLLDNLPPQLHIAMTTREDPQLPLARLRARGQLTELRAADLRFTAPEAAEFLEGLDLSVEDIDALEQRTEGWIAGLQLAAISMQGHQDTSNFIHSFTGSHRFVMDYLVEEVLNQQPERVQQFLLQTSVLDRMCGALCDAVLLDQPGSGQATLEYIERTNLFLVPLDNERRWYRYHHLFSELLRQRLGAISASGDVVDVPELHVRASGWFEENGFELDAFRHATEANDLALAERLIAGKGAPLYLRGGAGQVLSWLESLPVQSFETSPSLCVMFAGVLSIVGQVTRVEAKLLAAEAAMQGSVEDEEMRDLRPDNAPARSGSNWQLGLAHLYQKNRSEARVALAEAIAGSETSGNVHVNILATTCLGSIQESDNQLHLANRTYRRALQLIGEPPGPVACEAHVGLARISYEWNDLEAAQQHGDLSVRLARQIEIPSVVASELLLARLQLAHGDADGAIASLAQTEHLVRDRKFWFRLPEVVSAQVLALIRQGSLSEATHLAQTHDLPLSRARVALAEGDASSTLALLAPLREEAEARKWHDERLTIIVLEALAYQTNGEPDMAVRLLADALAFAEPGGFIRRFVDEGLAIAQLVTAAAARGLLPEYTARLMAAFEAELPTSGTLSTVPESGGVHSLIDPLSQRELEVLQLIAQGLSNDEIAERLFLALSTVKGHNRVIFGKLDVQRRTEAVARARELGIL